MIFSQKKATPILALFVALFFFNCKGQVENNNVPDLLKLDCGDRGLLLTSINQGKTWTAANKGLPPDIQISFLANHGDQIYVGTEKYGLFTASSKDLSWQALPTFTLPNPKITALYIHENKIYVGVYQAGIFVSSDGGMSWKAQNHGLENLSIMSILVKEDVAFAGTNGGIFKSEMPDLNWRAVSESAQITALNSNKDGSHLIAGTHKGILHSDDNGENWEWVLEEMPMHNTAIFQERVYGMAIRHGLQRSDDFGKTWVNVDADLPDGAYVFEMSEIGNQLVASHHDGVYISTNFGESWTLVYPTPGERFRDLLWLDGVLYGGTVKR